MKVFKQVCTLLILLLFSSNLDAQSFTLLSSEHKVTRSTPIRDVQVTKGDITLFANNVFSARNKANKLKILDAAQPIAIDTSNPSRTFTYRVVSSNFDYEPDFGSYYAIIGIDGTDITLRIDIEVILNDQVLRGQDYTIAGSNLHIGRKDAHTITKQAILDHAKAHSFSTKDKNITSNIDLEGIENITSEVGTYPIRLISQEEPSVFIDLNVFVKDFDYSIRKGQNYFALNDVYLDVTSAKKLTTTQHFKDAANVWAYDDYLRFQSTLVSHNFLPQVGTYTFVFAAAEEPDMILSSTFTVLPDDVVVTSPNYVLAGNHFRTNPTIAQEIDEEDILDLSNASAFNRITMENAKPSVNNHNIKPINGIYDVQLGVVSDNTTSALIKATVDNGNRPYLDVPSPVIIKIGTTYDLKGDIIATDVEDGDLIDKVVIEGSLDTNKAGIYQLRYVVTDSDYNRVSRTRTIIVDDGSIQIVGDYILQAYNFATNVNDGLLDNSDILSKAKAKAWALYDLEEVDVIITDNSNYQNQVGNYKFTFAVEQEPTSISNFLVTVYENDVSTTKDNYSIAANHVTLSLYDVPSLTDNALLTLSKAHAWLNTDYATSLPIVIDNLYAIKPHVGTYTVYLSIKDNEDIKIAINVKVEGIEFGISAKDSVLSLKDAQQIKSDEDLLKAIKADAWYVLDHSIKEEISIIESDFKQETGVYTIKIGVKKDVTIATSVTLKVIDNDHVISGNNFYLTGNDFVVGLSEIEDLDALQLLDLVLEKGHVQSYNYNHQEAGNILTIMQPQVEGIGAYAYVFTLLQDRDLVLTITMHVYDDSLIYAINANDFELKVSEVEDLLDDHIIERSQATLEVSKPSFSPSALSLTPSDLQVHVKEHNIMGNPGLYQVTLHIHDDIDVEKTINVTVLEDDDQVEPSKPVKPNQPDKATDKGESIVSNLPKTGFGMKQVIGSLILIGCGVILIIIYDKKFK